jgi:hypothetical protein
VERISWKNSCVVPFTFTVTLAVLPVTVAVGPGAHEGFVKEELIWSE